MANTNYNIVRNQPVARFYYKGNHTHPVRRTVVLIESTPTYIRGYEIREGSRTRRFNDAPVKSYRKDKIAKIADLDKRRVMRTKAKSTELGKATLKRENVLDLVKNGI